MKQKGINQNENEEVIKIERIFQINFNFNFHLQQTLLLTTQTYFVFLKEINSPLVNKVF